MAIFLYVLSSVASLAAASAVLFPLCIFVYLIRRFSSDAQLPGSLPWAGVGPKGGRYARLRANLRGFFGMESLLDEGYTKYSKNNRAYVLPHPLTGPEVVLPVSQTRWLLEQPDTILNQTEVNRQFLEADHTFLHPNIVREPVHPEVIKRELTHRLSSFADDIVEELRDCLEENWGTDTEAWREVKVYDTLLDVISRLSTRVFVGKTLSRNKEFLHSARMFDKNVVIPAAGLNLMPEILKPIIGPILTVYDRMQYLTISKFVLPLINERLKQLEPLGEKLPLYDQKPNDYFQWAIDHALAHWDPLELTPKVIACRLACLCFAAIQSSVISITNTLFDIASSPECSQHLAAMREEVLAEVSSLAPSAASDDASDSLPSRPDPSTRTPTAPSPWGKAALARMVHVDSALRESMRLNGFVARGIMKRVTARAGVTLPDGSHVPYGTKIGIQAYNVHRDSEYYADAETYDAFRFVEPSTEKGAQESASGSDSESPKDTSQLRRKPEAREPKALVSTSPTFLAFSHGPNSCPGRFFAANQLKLTLAHIALYYEIEPIAQRPSNKWFVGSMAPPMWETLRVRRKA